MTLEDIKRLPLLQTKAVSFAAEDPATHGYIVLCIQAFFSGDYGLVPPDDTAANNKELAAGNGHILARYKAKGKLSNDIYINAVFDTEMPGIDSNNIMIMYVDEY